MALAPILSTTPDNIYQSRITEIKISTLIWRQFLISNNHTIADLHDCIQIIIDRSDTYLHQLRIHGKNLTGSKNKTELISKASSIRDLSINF